MSPCVKAGVVPGALLSIGVTVGGLDGESGQLPAHGQVGHLKLTEVAALSNLKGN